MTDKYFDKYEEEEEEQQFYDETNFNFNFDNLERELERNNEQNSIQNTNPSDVKTFGKTSCLIQIFEENLNSESKKWMNETPQIIGNKDDDNGLKALGRKRKIHSKYSDDNLRRKIKGLILDCLFDFINKQICILYNNDIGKGIYSLQFKNLNKKKLSSTNVNYNQKLLYKTLEEIFSKTSEGISSYLKNHNNNLIKSLKNEIDYKKSNYFQNLFNLTFLQCINHINGTECHQELLGIKNRSEILDKFSDDEDYMKLLDFYFCNYESIINSKKGRRSRRGEENKEDYLDNLK